MISIQIIPTCLDVLMITTSTCSIMYGESRIDINYTYSAWAFSITSCCQLSYIKQ